MYRSVLVPLDGSSFSEHSLPLALALAKKGAAVHLFHVQSSMESDLIEAQYYNNEFISILIERHQIYLDTLLRKLEDLGASSVTATVKVGAIADTIRGQVHECDADLVLMTTHGRGPFARFWLGSVADSLLRDCPAPLLLVKPTAGDSPPQLEQEVSLKRLLVPLDGSGLAESIMEPAVSLGSAFDAEFSLLRVLQPLLPVIRGTEMLEASKKLMDDVQRLHDQARNTAQQYLEGVAQRLRQRSLRVETLAVDAESVADEILRRAEPPIDAVCLATHGRSGLPRIFVGSVADKVVRGSHIPVLISRPHP